MNSQPLPFIVLSSCTILMQLFKNAQKALRAYNGDIAKALLHVFPDIGLDRSMLRFGPTLSCGPNTGGLSPTLKNKLPVLAGHLSKIFWSIKNSPSIRKKISAEGVKEERVSGGIEGGVKSSIENSLTYSRTAANQG